ncbi:D-alanyl-D-alanine carboxypeptidase family protein [Sanguibacter sp. A247]|uniref:D-alanyl-D-alanine carboxypeptidase family protein n=1 Tax=unclassified Sanguibacter TaxID=2645534 RepID=UPI003FD7E993
MSPSARPRRQRRRRAVRVLALLLVLAPAGVVYVALDIWEPTLPWATTPLPGSGSGTTSTASTPPAPSAPASTPPASTPPASTPPAGPESAGRHDRADEVGEPHRGYDVDSSSSVTVVVNKRRPLDPLDYTPDGLAAVGGTSVMMRTDAATALRAMRAAAQRDGHPIGVHSAMRTYDEQARTFEGWVAELGEVEAERSSARAGHSEHQTGLALDVVALGDACGVMTCFGETEASQWLTEHAHEYGYIVRFTASHEKWTGYQPEPWHLRYVGREVAEAIREAGGPSLEEFFGLPPAATYAD